MLDPGATKASIQTLFHITKGCHKSSSDQQQLTVASVLISLESMLKTETLLHFILALQRAEDGPQKLAGSLRSHE